MDTIEEQLWNYIDGHCTPSEKLEIEAKLAVNIQYHSTYQELLKVNEELNKIDFEEPSMSFTRNVMEKVSIELKPVALKTKVDQRIIYSIGFFFVFALAGIFVYALATSNLDYRFEFPKLDTGFDATKYINSSSILVFIFVDVVLASVYLDSALRKRSRTHQKS
ncbi:MAG: hypothetical protein ACQUHE_05670 [Bacteroidia bacterium]